LSERSALKSVEHALLVGLAFISWAMPPTNWRVVIELDNSKVVSCQVDGNPSRQFPCFL
jgi:hypothetical protein